jgi:methylmalonyl-CoA mutase
VANLITTVEQAKARENGHWPQIAGRADRRRRAKYPVIGITGTGGSGKSSLTDELIQRMLHDLKTSGWPSSAPIPSRRKTGGALLGDRIRMNAIGSPRVYMRSLATRRLATPKFRVGMPDAVRWPRRPGST